MSDEIDVDTKDLQETIEELHKERAERVAEEQQTHWTRYIALSTAVLAAFAAIAALESGSLANEGMIHQLQASDVWNEYQASRTKTHLYSLSAEALLDATISPAPTEPKAAKKSNDLRPKTKPERLRDYIGQVDKETSKTGELSKKANNLQEESELEMKKHHSFAYSVALLQVAIALGAVSALTRIKSVWLLSSILGAAGIVLFFLGFLAK